MNYNETLEFLYNSLPQFQRVGGAAYKAGLDRTIALDNSLGNPHRDFKSIHIAGTNGKGSTSQMVYEALRAEGYSVGLYTSPHLVDFRERVVVDDRMIPQGDVVDFVERNWETIEMLKPSFFEMTVALAFWYFSKCGVDYAVVEVGMGGALDSTNIINPELCVITNISLDHTQFLGDTVADIALQKAGIIKPSVPVVIGQSSEQYDEVFRRVASEQGAPIIFADKQTKQPYTPAMEGEYQRLNAQGAYVALRELGLSESSIKQGIESARVRGRWQVLSHSPLTICDTAHNEDGLRFVTEQLERVRGDRRLIFVLAVVADKELSKVLPLLPSDAHYIFSEASIPRALPVDELIEAASAAGLRGQRSTSIAEAVAAAKQIAGVDDIIFIGGSTFTVAEALPQYFDA